MRPPWVDLRFLSPLSDVRAARLTDFLAGSPPGTLVDLGCGWAELLLRTVRAAPHLRGLGIAAPDRGARRRRPVGRSEPRDDEFVPLAEVVRLATDAGFAVRAVHEADQDEWDAFENGYCAAWADWLVEHAADGAGPHPEADDVRERLTDQRTRYLAGYRGVLGLAYLELLAV